MKTTNSDPTKQMRPARDLFTCATVVTLMFTLTGCITTSPADRHFNRGNYPAAASNYEREIERGFMNEVETAQALYRLTLIYGMPDAPDWNREKIWPLLERLRSDYPSTLYGVQAARILESGDEIERLQADLVKKQERIALLDRELGSSQNIPEDPEPDRSADEERIAQLTLTVNKLRAEIETLQTRLAEQATEFEQLKRIDLTTPP